MNKEELVAEVAKVAKVSKKEAYEVLTATIDTIEKSVKKGEKLFTIHADSQGAIDQAYDFASKEDIVKIK